MSVVVNRVLEPGQGMQAFEKLGSVMKRFTGLELSFLGEIGEDPVVTQRRLGQMPLAATDRGSQTVRSVEAILAKLTDVVGPLEPRTCEGGRGLESRFTEHRLFL